MVFAMAFLSLAFAGSAEPGLSRDELASYIPSKGFQKKCGFEIKFDGSIVHAKATSLGFRTVSDSSKHFKFHARNQLPPPYEMIVLKSLDAKAVLVINTQTRTIVGMGGKQLLGINSEGYQEWSYVPCGLTTKKELELVDPSCDCQVSINNCERQR
jgi:hypothetical protein